MNGGVEEDNAEGEVDEEEVEEEDDTGIKVQQQELRSTHQECGEPSSPRWAGKSTLGPN